MRPCRELKVDRATYRALAGPRRLGWSFPACLLLAGLFLLVRVVGAVVGLRPFRISVWQLVLWNPTAYIKRGWYDYHTASMCVYRGSSPCVSCVTDTHTPHGTRGHKPLITTATAADAGFARKQRHGAPQPSCYLRGWVDERPLVVAADVVHEKHEVAPIGGVAVLSVESCESRGVRASRSSGGGGDGVARFFSPPYSVVTRPLTARASPSLPFQRGGHGAVTTAAVSRPRRHPSKYDHSACTFLAFRFI